MVLYGSPSIGRISVGSSSQYDLIFKGAGLVFRKALLTLPTADTNSRTSDSGIAWPGREKPSTVALAA
jgi:hypothetical protein